MTQSRLLTALIAPNLAALHASAREFDREMNRLTRLHPHDPELLIVIEAALDTISAGCAFLESRLDSEAIATAAADYPLQRLIPTKDTVRSTSVASTFSWIRRAARLMENHCTSTADQARQLGLQDVEEAMRTWAREWIGLEVSINSAAGQAKEGGKARAAWNSLVNSPGLDSPRFVAA